MTELRPKLAELFAYMDSTRAALIATARGMSTSFAEMRPREGAWSPAEVLTHLAIVEHGVAELVNKSVAKARAEGLGPDLSEESFMRSLDKFGVAETMEKLSAPNRVHPENPKSIEESLASLAASRERLKSALADGSDMDLHSLKGPHPRLGELDVYQWALFVAQHEERHRRQMERTLDEVTELAAECAPIV
jgi:hypothetical protein